MQDNAIFILILSGVGGLISLVVLSESKKSDQNMKLAGIIGMVVCSLIALMVVAKLLFLS